MENIIAHNIKALRDKEKMSQGEFASHIGVKRGDISNWELGRNNPKRENLTKLRELYSLSMDDLFGKDLKVAYPEMFLPIKREQDAEETDETGEYFDLPKAFTKKELEEMLGKGSKQETFDIEHEEVRDDDITDEDMDLLRRYKQVEKTLGQRGINLMVLRHDDELKQIKSHLKLK